jgi:hypothetical protein
MQAPLPDDLRASLARDFFIRFTVKGRRTGIPRTTETTFVWDGGARLYISGYPGTRDYIANLAADPRIVVHTVERGVYYDIPATARVLRDRRERTPHLLAFLDRWATRPEAPRPLFRCAVASIRLNHRLRLPWWGPFWVARRILDRMPCAELTFDGPPVRRRSPPPAPPHSA